MLYCTDCGKPISDGDKFCSNCGSRVRNYHQNFNQRETVYEGTIHKCPRCGEVLESFVSHCPLCGHEIRDTKVSSATAELAKSLQLIESQTMPFFAADKSFLKRLLGKDFSSDEENNAKTRFEKQKQQQKASLIINCSIPNTKEDIFEFIVLASSNIESKDQSNDVVLKAWISKLEQVYQKAELSVNDSKTLDQIKTMYDRAKKKALIRRITPILPFLGCILIYAFCMGMLGSPEITLAVVILVVAILIIFAVKYVSNKKKSQN